MGGVVARATARDDEVLAAGKFRKGDCKYTVSRSSEYYAWALYAYRTSGGSRGCEGRTVVCGV